MTYLEMFRDKVLTDVGMLKREPSYKLTGFLAVVGRKYAGELMVVGRAVNGWTAGIATTELQDSFKRHAYARSVYDSVKADAAEHCPMAWVTEGWASGDGYRASRSAFWRVIRCLAIDMVGAGETDPWSSHLVWSNLYKMSPEKGGNPGASLRNVQVNGCKQLLRREIECYRPKRLLFLTGLEWVSPFLDSGWHARSSDIDAYAVQAAGMLTCGPHIVQVVVAHHPRGLDGARCATDITSAFAALQRS